MILSVDDGCVSDIRLAALAKEYNIDTVFYWPVEWHSLAYEKGYEPLTYSQATVIADQFEVGAHTITHRHLTKISIIDAMREIADSKKMLEDLFSIDVTKFCPPRGYTTPELTEFTLQLYESQRLTKGKGLVHIHPNSGANNNMDWQLYALAQEEVKELWCHSWELDKFDLWDQLEEYLAENAA
jgi:peptidoglycan/xylan/chitin deacetylase (PgdA/CDA1 family)